MQKLNFNQIEYDAADFLDSFTMFKKQSSNVAFYGFNANSMFVQFNNGSCYLYELTHEAVAQAIAAESIGKFVSNNVVGKYPSQKLEPDLVTPCKRETAVLKVDVKSFHNVLLAKAGEEVFVISKGPAPEVENKSGRRFIVATEKLMFKAVK